MDAATEGVLSEEGTSFWNPSYNPRVRWVYSTRWIHRSESTWEACNWPQQTIKDWLLYPQTKKKDLVGGSSESGDKKKKGEKKKIEKAKMEEDVHQGMNWDRSHCDQQRKRNVLRQAEKRRILRDLAQEWGLRGCACSQRRVVLVFCYQ